MGLDELADVVDRARGLRSAHQEQVLPVARDPVHRRAQARVVGHLGVGLALGHPRPEDLLANVLDLDRPGLVGQVGERRFHGDQPVEQVLLVVLEADVEHVRLAARGDVARHLERHRGLAGSLRAADQEQLAGPQARADRLVERREPERHGLVFRHLAGRDLLVQIDKHVERRARRQAAVVCIQSPGRRRDVRFGGFGTHAVDSSPMDGGRPSVAPRIPDSSSQTYQFPTPESSSHIRAIVRMPVS